MGIYLELFKNGFDESVSEKRKSENWPYVAHDVLTGEVVYTDLDEYKATFIYTTTDDNMLNFSTWSYGEAKHTYKNGIGVISCSVTPTILYHEFQNLPTLKTLIIPDTITRLSDGCFAGSRALESINLDNVLIIPRSCFLGSALHTIGSIRNDALVYSDAFEYTPWYLNYISPLPDGPVILGSTWYSIKGDSATQPDGVPMIIQDGIVMVNSMYNTWLWVPASYLELPASITVPFDLHHFLGVVTNDSSKDNPIVVFKGTTALWKALNGENAFYGISGYTKCSDGYVQINLSV